ncbi:MAG: hypothetical protein J4428_05820 [Candidatus Aenigmarchaeota archaeon]|nr:hypothetical protein [Candidatus Aenigmarchaeota archaeon]
MNKKFFSIIGFALLTISVVSANAEEFDFEFIDSKNHTVSYNLTNATLLDITQNPPYGFIFKANGTNGEIFVSLPKTIPILSVESVPGFVLLNGQEIAYLPDDDTNCSYNFVVSVIGNTELEFIFAYWPERPLPIYYLDLDAECNMPLAKSIMEIKNKTCSNEKSIKFMNIRDEVVCVSSSSIHKLLDRGYLKPTEFFITEKYIE